MVYAMQRWLETAGWVLTAGHASYNASVHGSNTERSEPSGEHQEPSGLSSSDLNYPGDADLPTAQVVVQQQQVRGSMR